MAKRQPIDADTITLASTIILRSAEELFATQGYAETTIRQIAKAAMVNVSMVNYYFGSKQALYKLIFTIRLEQLNYILNRINSQETQNNKLEQFFQEYISHIEGYPHFHKILLREYNLLAYPELDSSDIKIKMLNNLNTLQSIITQHAKKISMKEIDISIFCINVFVLTPRLLLEQRKTFDLIATLENKDKSVSVANRIKNYFYSQLFKDIIH